MDNGHGLYGEEMLLHFEEQTIQEHHEEMLLYFEDILLYEKGYALEA